MTNQQLLLSVVTMLPLAMQASQKPNIIYIMTDQQSALAMSCMGNGDLHTPNMDRLAKNGVTFTNAYCSAPLSGPSRASMFTGYSSHELGMESNGKPMPEHIKAQSLGILVKKAGYECAYAGKWHVHTASLPDQEFGFKTLHPHADKGLAEACIAFLQLKHNRPFFLVASFDNPHNICEYAREQNLPHGDIPQVPLEECPGVPVNFARNPHDADIITYEKEKNVSAYPTRYYTADDWKHYRYTYFRLVEKIDAEIGKIVDEIEKQNLWENTVVIFTSDHGDGMGAHHWNQKSALYEEVVNIPLIVTLPGKKNAGTVLPQLINNGLDFFTSVCEWTGAKLPADNEGVSYKNLAETANPEMSHQPYVVTETVFDKGGATYGWMLRTANYKYVIYDKGRYREQLYDIKKDKGEMRNLAIEKKYEKELNEHRFLLKEWIKKHHMKSNSPKASWYDRVLKEPVDMK